MAILFVTVFFGLSSQDYYSAFVFCLCFVPLAYVCTRFLNDFLIPKYLLKKRYFRFWLFLFYLLCASLGLATLIIAGLFILVWDYSLVGIDPATMDIRFLLVGLYFIIIVGVAYRQLQRILNEQRMRELQDKMKVETELRLKEAELSLLKAQVNPHFLFNSLNSIYGLSLEKSEETPKMIMLLSEILDYTLYGCSSDFVDLNQEIELIENYAAIQKGRFANSFDIEIDMHEARQLNLSIAPLLFLPLVENCFKYAARKENEASKISIRMKVDNSLIFQIKNPLGLGRKSQKNGGIGIDNLRKRLDLIYPEQYGLEIRESEQDYEVELSLMILN
ncbi:sensor histidine kinase [Marinifilum caeruleilacunae]|nr:histidine kinase [Marinifilum caeruleilacunae]